MFLHGVRVDELLEAGDLRALARAWWVQQGSRTTSPVRGSMIKMDGNVVMPYSSVKLRPSAVVFSLCARLNATLPQQSPRPLPARIQNHLRLHQ